MRLLLVVHFDIFFLLPRVLTQPGHPVPSLPLRGERVLRLQRHALPAPALGHGLAAAGRDGAGKNLSKKLDGLKAERGETHLKLLLLLSEVSVVGWVAEKSEGGGVKMVGLVSFVRVWRKKEDWNHDRRCMQA